MIGTYPVGAMGSLYITATGASAPMACTGKTTFLRGDRSLQAGSSSAVLCCKGGMLPLVSHLRRDIGRGTTQASLGKRATKAGHGTGLRRGLACPVAWPTGANQSSHGAGTTRTMPRRPDVTLTLPGEMRRGSWAVAALGVGMGTQRGEKEKEKEEGEKGKGRGTGGEGEGEGEEEEAELGTSISDFTRFYENPAKGEVELQTSIISYWKKGPWWDILRPEVQVDLVSVVHIGDQEYYEDLQEELYTYDKVLYEMVVDRSAREEEEQRRREEEERSEAVSARQQYGNSRAVSRAVSRAGAQPGSRAGLAAGVREGTASVSLRPEREASGADDEGTVSEGSPAGARLATVGVWEKGSSTDVSAVTGNPWAKKSPSSPSRLDSSNCSPAESSETSPTRFFHRRQPKGRLSRPWLGQGDSTSDQSEEAESSEGEGEGEKGAFRAPSKGKGRGRGSAKPRVLLSGKRPLPPRKPRKVVRRRGSSVVGMIQRFMARAMRLSFQLDHIDYQAPNFLNADLDYDTFCNLQKERKESIFTLAKEVSVKSTKAVMAVVSSSPDTSGEKPTGPLQRSLLWASRSVPMPLVGLLLIDSVCRPPGARSAIANQPAVKALLNLDVATALKVFLAQQLASDALDTAATVMKESVIVGERNKAAMQELHKALEGGSRRIAIFYGSAHLPDLDRRLKTELGLVPVAIQWRTAWSILKAASRFSLRRNGMNGSRGSAAEADRGTDRGGGGRGGVTGPASDGSSFVSFGRKGSWDPSGADLAAGESYLLPEGRRSGYGRSTLYRRRGGGREDTVTGKGEGGIVTWLQRRLQWPLSRYQTVALLLMSLVLAIDLWLWEQLIEGVESWSVQVIVFTVKILDQGWSL